MTSSLGLSRRVLLLAVGLLLFWLLLATALRDNLGSSARLFNDYADRADYFAIGRWLPANAVPYLGVRSEYPQIATYLFGVLYLPFLAWPNLDTSFFNYSILFALVMIGLYVGMAAVLERLLAPSRKAWTLALLLPAPLYFAYNRFDVLPSLLTLLALYLVSKRAWPWAGVLLGVGALTKWYPALLVPPVLVYMRSHAIPSRKMLGFLFGFGAACGLILLPTFVSGGLTAVVSPYMLHASRGLEKAALPTLVEPLIAGLVGSSTDFILPGFFLILQFVLVAAVLFTAIDSFDRLLGWCLLIIAAFVLFSRVYSPQWLLWAFPLLLLLSRTPKDLLLVTLLGTVTYIEYPLLYVGLGLNPGVMTIVGCLNAILWGWVLAWSAAAVICRPKMERTYGDGTEAPRGGVEQSR